MTVKLQEVEVLQGDEFKYLGSTIESNEQNPRGEGADSVGWMEMRVRGDS